MRAEPLDRRRRGGGVGQAHADASQNTEADDQPHITLHQAGDDAADRQEEPAGGGADFGAIFVLKAASGNHEQREHEAAYRISPGSLSIG